MQIINFDSKLCDLLITNPSLLPVLNRFDILLGVGDKTVAKVCEEKKIDKVFLTTILNTYIHKDYFPENVLISFSVTEIVDYLTKTNNYYEHFQIPNIERHFHFLMAKCDQQNGNLTLLQKFFFEVKHELQTRIEEDRNVWFPSVLKLSKNKKLITEVSHTCHAVQEDSIEAKLSDLMNMFIIHLSGNYDANLANAVLTALYALKTDISQNNRIRERILRPLYEALVAIKG